MKGKEERKQISDEMLLLKKDNDNDLTVIACLLARSW